MAGDEPPPIPVKPGVDPAAKLGWGEKLGYSAGDFASCLYFAIFMNFLMYFYTDVFGIGLVAAGTIIGITRTWDWINDPIMGLIADRTHTRFGKYRPWLLWMIAPWIIVGILTFTTFEMGATAKFIYALVAYSLLTMIYTAINIPYSALIGVMTSDSKERTYLASFRFVGAFAGTFVVNVSMMWLISFFGQGNPQLGFTLAVALYGCLAGLFFYITFATSKERVKPPPSQETSLKKDFLALVKNWPWVMMIILSILTILWISVRGTVTVYYFKYLSGDATWVGYFLGAGSAAQVFGALTTRFVAEWLGGKKRAFMILNLIAAAFVALFYFIDPTNLPLILTHQVISSFLAAPLMPLFWAMIADTADYGAWKQNHRSTGLLLSAGTLSQKIGWSIGPMIAATLLAYFGYVANVDQTPRSIEGISLMMSWIPAGFAVIAALATLAYPIGRKLEQQMQTELGAQRATASQA